MRSLTVRLVSLWLLSLAASLTVAVLLVQLERQSLRAQVSRAEAVVERACDQIGDRYAFYVTGWTPPGTAVDRRFRVDLLAVVDMALAHEDGVEGGVWQAGAGSLAYAYPTYEGSGPKTDLPAAERDRIRLVNEDAARTGQAAGLEKRVRAQTLLLRSCPLGGPVPDLTAWTMMRVRASAELGPLRLGLAVLFALMLLMTGWLGRILVVWGRQVRRIEASLGRAEADGLPAMARTGERELDRIIDALNEAGARLGAARRRSDEMALRAAEAERLAALGRVAAGVAHEIRNPIAAARLQGENGLAGDDARRREAIGDMLVQIDRLDALATELLAMTQRVEPQPEAVALAPFLRAGLARHEGDAAARGIALALEAEDGSAVFDPAMIGRALDNLLANAIRHAPDGGTVRVCTESGPALVAIVVEDSGAGVPAGLAGHLFEPFVTSRADGTGLGLAIAREMAAAHGGRLMLRRAGGSETGRGAVFAVELPLGSTWPRS